MIVSILRIGASSRFIGGGWPPTHASSCTMIRLRRTPSRSNWSRHSARANCQIVEAALPSFRQSLTDDWSGPWPADVSKRECQSRTGAVSISLRWIPHERSQGGP